ncbi:MAG: chromate efflux transporter [Pseudomonadota bacterium]
MTDQSLDAPGEAGAPSLGDLTRVFGRIGLLSFGGPAAQIALMHRELVETRAWLGERDFLSALSFCMLLPGPEAMQLCTYAGWRLRGIAGGLIAGVLFVLPGALVILALAFLYASFGAQPLVQSAFLGVKAAVIVIVLQALLKVAGKALTGTAAWAVAGLAFLGIYVFEIPFPVIIVVAALYGALSATDGPAPAAATSLHRSTRATTLLAVALAVLWAAPLVLAWALNAELLLALGLFFSKLAIVTFGGAYAVLAYMTQEVVQVQGWLTTAQMIDALGLAETTPGPLILVTEFVGTLTAIEASGWALGLAAAAMTLWVTFVPCFLWIFVAAPYVDWLTGQPRLKGALDAITAAVVGVIANLSLWFALHVFFGTVTAIDLGPAAPALPVPASFDPLAALLCVLAAGLLLQLKAGLPLTLAIVAGAGLLSGILISA